MDLFIGQRAFFYAFEKGPELDLLSLKHRLIASIESGSLRQMAFSILSMSL